MHDGLPLQCQEHLDKNYLYFAERQGAQVLAERKVVDVKPLGGQADGRDGYEVRTVQSTAWLRTRPRRFTCRGLVFAASALGTMDLLLRLRQKGSLPRLSAEVGNRVRTNAESLIGVRVPGSTEDLSAGVAIGYGFYLDDFTHIEATRYPSGSDAMGLLGTLLTDGRPDRNRILLWLKILFSSLVLHPIKTVRASHPFGWARESLILLCMQTLDGYINMRLARRWWWPFGKTLMSHGRRIPAFIPHANDFAREVASFIHGTPMSMVTEILFDIPGTAHALGGCPIAGSAEQGVVDSRNCVFGYRNMYVCDGSVIAVNLGVNPSLTITALTERTMSFIPPAAHADWQAMAEQSNSMAGEKERSRDREGAVPSTPMSPKRTGTHRSLTVAAPILT
jgi:cholesterol oxidase